jgi:hypothetical protein
MLMKAQKLLFGKLCLPLQVFSILSLAVFSGQLSAFDPAENLQFKGMFKLRGNAKFNIYNKENQSSKWLKIGQRTGDYTLKSYDEDGGNLIFENADGEEGTLGLAQAKAAGNPVGGIGGSKGPEIESTNLRFKNGLYYELGKEETPFSGSVVKDYPTGKPWYKRGYKDGKKHGETVEWFPNGQKKYEMYYDDNQRTGVWSYWDQNGKLTAKREYEKNQFKRNLPLE